MRDWVCLGVQTRALRIHGSVEKFLQRFFVLKGVSRSSALRDNHFVSFPHTKCESTDWLYFNVSQEESVIGSNLIGISVIGVDFHKTTHS